MARTGTSQLGFWYAVSRTRLAYFSLQRNDKLRQIQPERSTERPQFNHIYATLAAFALGDEGLIFSDLPGKLHLRETGPFARFTEDCEENAVTS